MSAYEKSRENYLEEDESWYYGLANAEGVEAFTPEVIDDSGFGIGLDYKEVLAEQFGMCVKSIANPDKPYVVFRVALKISDGDEINNLFEEGNQKEALLMIKEKSIRRQVSTYQTTLQEAKSKWNRIPS
jgi:hypothetical protein